MLVDIGILELRTYDLPFGLHPGGTPHLEEDKDMDTKEQEAGICVPKGPSSFIVYLWAL